MPQTIQTEQQQQKENIIVDMANNLTWDTLGLVGL